MSERDLLHVYNVHAARIRNLRFSCHASLSISLLKFLGSQTDANLKIDACSAGHGTDTPAANCPKNQRELECKKSQDSASRDHSDHKIIPASNSSTCILNVMSYNSCTDIFQHAEARSTLALRTKSDLRTCILVIARVDIHTPCDMPVNTLYAQTIAVSSDMILEYCTRRLPKKIPGFLMMLTILTMLMMLMMQTSKVHSRIPGRLCDWLWTLHHGLTGA